MENYDVQFNLRRRHPVARWRILYDEVNSAFTRLMTKHDADISYGDTPGQKLDIFAAKQPNAPVFVFIHGGYFRALDKRQYSYIAKHLNKAGFTVVVVNYDLVPKVTIPEIVEQNILAIKWIFQHIERWHGNPKHLILCGHSVGAFMVAKLLEYSWNEDIKEAFKGALMISGLYDLQTMRQSYLNDTLKLTDSCVKALSPVNHKLQVCLPTIVAVGENESEEFIRQSRIYSHKLNDDEHQHNFLLLDQKNHYEVVSTIVQHHVSFNNR
jgi:arylformamidase